MDQYGVRVMVAWSVAVASSYHWRQAGMKEAAIAAALKLK